MIYSIPYLLLFIFLLYLYIISRYTYKDVGLYEKTCLYRANIYEKLALFSYILFYGLRGFMFTDVFEYYNFYDSLNNAVLNWGVNEVAFDPGYVASNIVIHKLNSNYFFFQFIWTLIDVILLYYILKHETGKYFLLAFAFLIPLFDGIQINLLRNIKGILLFFYAIRYIRAKKLIKYTILIILGATLHISTIILWPFYFFINRDIHKVLIFLSVISIAFYFTDLSFLNQLFIILSVLMGGKIEAVLTSYENSTVSAGLTMGFLYRTFILIVLLSKYKTLNGYNRVALNIAILYICSNTAFNSILVMRDRFASLFALGLICILPFISDAIKKEFYRKNIVIINIICLFGFVYNPHSSIVAKYTNVITGIEKMSEAKNRIDSYIINNERE